MSDIREAEERLRQWRSGGGTLGMDLDDCNMRLDDRKLADAYLDLMPRLRELLPLALIEAMLSGFADQRGVYFDNSRKIDELKRLIHGSDQ